MAMMKGDEALPKLRSAVLLPSSQKAVVSLVRPPPSCATKEGNEDGTPSAEDKTTNEVNGDTPTTIPEMRWGMNEDGAPSTEDETKGDTSTTPPEMRRERNDDGAPLTEDETKGDTPTTSPGMRRERNEDGAPSTGFPKERDSDVATRHRYQTLPPYPPLEREGRGTKAYRHRPDCQRRWTAMWHTRHR